jgi:DNA-binding NtrC family response regulator
VGRTALVVDAETSNRKLVRRVLRDAGWTTPMADDAAQARALLGVLELDVIITCLVVEEIAELLDDAHERAIPVIVVSSIDISDAPLFGAAGHYLAYFRKPIDVTTFAALVDRALGALP